MTMTQLNHLSKSEKTHLPRRSCLKTKQLYTDDSTNLLKAQLVMVRSLTVLSILTLGDNPQVVLALHNHVDKKEQGLYMTLTMRTEVIRAPKRYNMHVHGVLCYK